MCVRKVVRYSEFSGIFCGRLEDKPVESRGHGGNLACEGSEGSESLKDLQRPLVWNFALGSCDIWLAGVGELPPLRREQHQGDRTPRASSGSARGGCDPEGPGLDFALEAELGSKSRPGGTDYKGFRGQREELRLGTLPGEAFGKVR